MALPILKVWRFGNTSAVTNMLFTGPCIKLTGLFKSKGKLLLCEPKERELDRVGGGKMKYFHFIKIKGRAS